MAFPVRTPDGRVVGVLGARVDWSWANELRDALRNSQRLAPDVELWVIGAGGEVLIGPEAGRQIFPDGLRQEMQAKVRGTFLDHDRGNMVTGYAVAEGFRDYPGLNWIVVARRPAAVAYARAHELGWIVLIVGTVVALFGATLVLLAADQLAAPLRALAKHADRIGRESSETMIARQRGSREMLTLSSALRSLLIRTAAGDRPAEEVALKVAAPSHGEDPNAPGAPAGSDALTGLMSRGAFMTQAIDAMRYYKRYDRSIATLVLDIDRFQHVNRKFGRAAGDAVIRRVAAVVADMVRSTDKVARYGGEDFVVLLREIDEAQTRLLAERILKKVESAAVIHGSDVIGVTVSIGAAVVAKQDRDVEDLIERADRALYAAKDAGRNCVRMAVPADPEMRAA